MVSAVESIKGCNKLPAAASDLNTAAAQRKALVTKLGALSVDKLPDHASLTDALTKAWQASSAADAHYASWAGQAQSNPKVCHGGHARITQETQAGDRESGTATIQKKRAVKLWNSIANAVRPHRAAVQPAVTAAARRRRTARPSPAGQAGGGRTAR